MTSHRELHLDGHTHTRETTAVTPATDEEVEELLRWLGVHGHRLRTVILGSGFIGDAHMALLALVARIDVDKAHSERRERDATEGMAALNRVIADQRDELRERDATIADDHRAMATVLDALGEDGMGLDEDDATADDWLALVMPAIERLYKQDSDADATIARLQSAIRALMDVRIKFETVQEVACAALEDSRGS